MGSQRKVIHVDMDAFFAAIEQRDDPSLRGKPIVVGGPPESRGVVATCSYEARKFGIHSAMPCSQAGRLCPHAIFVRPRFEAYREASNRLHDIFHRYTDLIEPLSLDEAYLDVTENKVGSPSATLIAQEIREAIRAELNLTGSAGVSYNKFLAKCASDIDKPDGLTVILPEQALEFLAKLPIERFYGIGKVTARKMRDLDIRNGYDLRQKSQEFLQGHFGKQGAYFYKISRGIDERPVNPSRERKSLGKETTFHEDLTSLSQVHEVLAELARGVETSLAKRQLRGSTIVLKVRYENFETVTRSHTFAHPICDANSILHTAGQLLELTEAGERPVRLLGISVSNFDREVVAAGDGEVQLLLPLASNL